MTDSGSTFGFRGSLDGLRSIAVGLVVLYHLGHWQAGWVGVDLFFVLSGYLITGLLSHELANTSTVALTRFWIRRARRLIPGVVLLMALAAAIAVIRPDTRGGTRVGDIFGHAFYVTNWVSVFRETSYWSSHEVPSLFRHAWSLAIEEQVYLVWPVVVWWLCRGHEGPTRRTRLKFAAGGLYAVFAMIQLGRERAGATIEELYVGTHNRVSAFLLGALCVLVFDGRLARRAAQATVSLGLAGVLVASLVLQGDERGTFRGPLLLAGFASAAAVTGAANLMAGNRLYDALTWMPFRAVGRWSYGIYLYHWPLIVATRTWDVGIWRVLFVGGLSVVLAAASYEFVEHPIRTGAWRPSAMPGVAVGAATVMITALIVVPTPGRKVDESYRPRLVLPVNTDVPAVPSTLDPLPGATLDSVPGTVPDSTSDSTGGSAPATAPAGSAPDSVDSVPDASPPGLGSAPEPPAVEVERPVRLLVVGDSTAVTIADQWAATTALRRGDIEVISGGQIGCPVVTTVAIRKHGREQSTDYCPKFRETWPAIFDDFEPDAVLMVTSPSPGWEHKFDVDGDYYRLPDPTARRSYDDEFDAMLELLDDREIPLLITESPNLAGAEGEDEQTRQTIDDVNAMYREWDEAHDNVAVIAYDAYFADLDTEEGRRQRPDGVHPSDSFMGEIADSWLIPEILRQFDLFQQAS